MTINEQLDLSCIEINPTAPTKKSVIWLHGLGADGNDFVPIVSELNLPSTSAVRFIFPHAPIMPITINGGNHMRAWFDIYEFSLAAKMDSQGIKRSVTMVEKLIAREEAQGTPSSNIILAGFSQGAVIALTTGLCFPKPLGGIMALSGFLPLVEEVLEKASAANRPIPIFVAHGTEDAVLPYALGNATQAALKQAGYNVAWHSYSMAHSVCAMEISDIRKWIIDPINPQ
jgi:phospholipase/carboxylesterase